MKFIAGMMILMFLFFVSFVVLAYLLRFFGIKESKSMIPEAIIAIIMAVVAYKNLP
jgi:arginine exporter protein ArgO